MRLASGLCFAEEKIARHDPTEDVGPVAAFFAARPPCLVGMEACGTAHFWALEIAAFGHDVRLMPRGYVKPYVKRNKHDAADAEAVCEAVRRPSMRSGEFYFAIIGEIPRAIDTKVVFRKMLSVGRDIGPAAGRRMLRGEIRRIQWDQGRQLARHDRAADILLESVVPPLPGLTPGPPVAAAAVLDPPPATAEEEAVALLRIAAEVEGSLMVQYLFTAGSLLQGVSVGVPGFDHPILSDDWYDLMRSVAKQEMGHLITVQNLLLSLDARPHVDRENFPVSSPLYPFPFSLQSTRLSTLAKYVCAEAPREVASADRTDYEDAVRRAGAVVGDIPRAGQIYERLFWLLQDGDAPQDLWPGLRNPFPDWPKWHVDPARIGFNQDRQGNPNEWRGNDSSAPVDSGIYVLQVADKALAREAVYTIGLQGEGPVGDPGFTHFDKFLRIFREQRAVDGHAGSPAFARNQSDDPKTGVSGPATITDPKTVAWAKLGNLRYQMLLTDIALSVSIGQSGTAPSVSATRRDFGNWAFTEMLACIKPISEELRQMPLAAGSTPESPRAGLPYELSNQNLPTAVADQIQYLRDRAGESVTQRAQIATSFNPTPKQAGVLKALGNIDAAVLQKLGGSI